MLKITLVAFLSALCFIGSFSFCQMHFHLYIIELSYIFICIMFFLRNQRLLINAANEITIIVANLL